MASAIHNRQILTSIRSSSLPSARTPRRQDKFWSRCWPLMKRIVIITALIGLSASLTRGQIASERTVKDNVITSLRDPQARIELPDWFEYVGADRWVLFDIADCE